MRLNLISLMVLGFSHRVMGQGANTCNKDAYPVSSNVADKPDHTGRVFLDRYDKEVELPGDFCNMNIYMPNLDTRLEESDYSKNLKQRIRTSFKKANDNNDAHKYLFLLHLILNNHSFYMFDLVSRICTSQEAPVLVRNDYFYLNKTIATEYNFPYSDFLSLFGTQHTSRHLIVATSSYSQDVRNPHTLITPKDFVSSNKMSDILHVLEFERFMNSIGNKSDSKEAIRKIFGHFKGLGHELIRGVPSEIAVERYTSIYALQQLWQIGNLYSSDIDAYEDILIDMFGEEHVTAVVEGRYMQMAVLTKSEGATFIPFIGYLDLAHIKTSAEIDQLREILNHNMKGFSSFMKLLHLVPKSISSDTGNPYSVWKYLGIDIICRYYNRPDIVKFFIDAGWLDILKNNFFGKVDLSIKQELFKRLQVPEPDPSKPGEGYNYKYFKQQFVVPGL